jgi:energy-coupling factor transport system permease protein
MALMTPIGNYLARDGWLGRLDARIKLLTLFSYLTSLFLVESWLGLAAFMLLLLVAYLGSKVPLKLAARGLLPLLAILAFTLLANGLGSSPEATPPPPLLPGFGPGSLPAPDDALPAIAQPGFVPLAFGLGIRPSGLLRGAYLSLRIVLLFSATALLTYTSSLVALSDALVALLRPLSAWRLPTEDIAMVMTIALRFIQLTADEAEQVMFAQQARGAAFDRGGPLKRVQAWSAVLVPLFVKLFRRADRLAAAMESRCYRGEGRTHLRQSRLKLQALACGLAASAALLMAGVMM